MLDSLDMEESDRMKILQTCKGNSSDRIIVVHGTDTMEDTAAVLGKANMGKTIVLTGAMIPYEFDYSDAFFNLGFAVSSVQLLPVGVYVLMNGQFFKWNAVTKNRRIGVFEAVS